MAYSFSIIKLSYPSKTEAFSNDFNTKLAFNWISLIVFKENIQKAYVERKE
jgi:hypothetical protein